MSKNRGQSRRTKFIVSCNCMYMKGRGRELYVQQYLNNMYLIIRKNNFIQYGTLMNEVG